MTKEHFSIHGLDNKLNCLDLFKGKHYFNITLIVLCIIYTVIFGYNGVVLGLNLFSFSFFLYRFILTLYGVRGDEDNAKMVAYTTELPKYCILLPMRNENIPVVRDLINNINKLNYPKDKLDVIMLVDQDDDYLEAIKAMDKPDYFRIESAAPEFPYTKPKVCNLGLYSTDAEYVTIYDAEDAPDPDQLLKVLYKFNNTDASCVQCRLNYNNQNPNWMSKFFNLEYLTWFSMTIVGLSKIQGDRAIIPLGGTSQHLRVKELIELGGWDAFNVTEDCDLGIRLAKLGKTTVISNSYTNEIAVQELKHFIPQRTRWQMGFMVTYINHCKDLNTFKELGLSRSIHFIGSIAGNFINPLITPLLFIIFLLSLFGVGGETYLATLPIITLIGNYILIVLSHLIASIRYQKGKYWIYSLFQPIYYLIQVYTVHRAVYKLFTATYQWEKTEHTVE
tara:strand:- start:66 stop:1409 length:1344 start_codon:yes stop_codon:yes gene_type:complete